MIDKSYGKFFISCDGCGRELEPTDTFDEATSLLYIENWTTNKIGTDWINLCPVCAKEV